MEFGWSPQGPGVPGRTPDAARAGTARAVAGPHTGSDFVRDFCRALGERGRAARVPVYERKTVIEETRPEFVIDGGLISGTDVPIEEY